MGSKDVGCLVQEWSTELWANANVHFVCYQNRFLLILYGLDYNLTTYPILRLHRDEKANRINLALCFSLLTDLEYLEAFSPVKDIPESVILKAERSSLNITYALLLFLVPSIFFSKLLNQASEPRFLNKVHSSMKPYWYHWGELLFLKLYSFLWSADWTYWIFCS